MSDPFTKPSTVIQAQRACPECGLQAYAEPSRIYQADNLVQDPQGNTLARFAYYRCSAEHLHRIPYAEAIVQSGTLGTLLDDLTAGRWQP
jgi:hypothetical protein